MQLTTGCFVLVTLGVSSVTLVSRNYSKQGARQAESLTHRFLPSLVTLARLQHSTLNLRGVTFQLALARDEAATNEQQRAFHAYNEDVRRSIGLLRSLSHDPEIAALIDTFAADVQAYREGAERFQAELRAGQFERAMATLDEHIDPAQQKIESQLRSLSEHLFRLSRDAGARTTDLLEQSDRAGVRATVVLAAFILLCLALSLAATRALLAQVQVRDAERQAAQAMLEKRVEERTAALRASEERIRLIVDTASDAIITFDAAGLIVAWNAQAETTFGWPATEALGRNLADHFLLPSRREPHHQRIRRFLVSGDSTELRQRIETAGLHRDGREIPLEVTISPIRIADLVLFSAFVRDITERKRAETELRDIHRQLVETSRHAGMAEVATGVLHNVGNVLNSVNVSATLVTDLLAASKTSNLSKIATMLQEQNGHVVDFLARDPKGRRIPGYLITLASDLATEQHGIARELGHLRQNIEHIKDIVAMQQSYATVSGVTEKIALSSLVEDALRMNAGALARHGLDVVRDYQADPVVTTERHKVLQILVNLIRNAKYACDESGRSDKRLTIRIAADADLARIVVADNGVGIPPENLTRIFAHGFTTRKNGHGFGLHSGALVAGELGGSLLAHSDGPGHGATFTLELPLAAPASLS